MLKNFALFSLMAVGLLASSNGFSQNYNNSFNGNSGNITINNYGQGGAGYGGGYGGGYYVYPPQVYTFTPIYTYTPVYTIQPYYGGYYGGYGYGNGRTTIRVRGRW